ncbi:hypothetical protein Kpol_1018p162 [Vanderwaltozyma polyspora DSM 70294]|uniref:non-specific serine/threonine protein kinase n=1 Tax=Vanderwaltozyma polyspora (strain ATCC 22028 / DSM 70294 / BCRC 21397 / CBS 2163 / NBRC 10782 / NRRL Y-8283 / UCD 57-17) TaxID=436907 RepID=A7TE02_VANPO|nr:uncharacterized protein Kpol_1018p162 [Vanderwaltozyma polyspora DSM 70294]EDO19622.1 hypothetical protein Kpol_1018p162 [Vanderwaltozyma polyspora DSM 70294]
MHSWKISKFRFGKSKDEKIGDDKGGLGLPGSGDNSTSDLDVSIRDDSSSGVRSSTEQRSVGIGRNSSNVASVRASQDGSSSASTEGDRATKQSTPNGLEVGNGVSSEPNTDTSSSGIMTVKVYKGDGFVLPFPITSNQQVLSKLLNSGVSSSNGGLLEEADLLSSQLARLSLEKQGSSEEIVLPGDSYTKFIPSTVKLPGSETLNPLIYFTIEFDNTVATIEPEYGTMTRPTFNKISVFDVTRKLPNLKIDIFGRIPSILLPSESWQQTYGSQDENLKNILEKIKSNQDIQLGSFLLPVNLKIDSAANIRLYSHHWVTLDNKLGKICLTVDYKPSKNKPLSIDDFDLLKVIGKGSFGKVIQVRKKDTQKIYALKAIRKAYIVSKSEVTHTLAERTVLSKVDCPFIVPLKFSFQSPEKLYLVLAFINGGELFFHLQKEGRFSLSRSRFYAAELLCALETLHKFDVIYRDLKPENILLDYQGHIALCDFGLCKLNMKDKDQTDTFCGTPEYLAPELLLGQGYSKVVDWWTLGVLLYEMLTGLPPYYDEDVPKMYKKILQEPLRFPDEFDKDAKDLLIGLLSRDPKRRLGYNGAQEIKSHPFFSQLSWQRLWMKGYIPPYKPPVVSSVDTSNFDEEFTREKPIDSVVDEFLSESVQQQFGGWTYVGNEQLGSSMAQGRSIR